MYIPKLLGACLIAVFIFPPSCLAEEKWLIVSQSESFNVGQEIILDTVKPEGLTIWPETLRLKLSGSDASEEIQLSPNKPVAGGTRRLYSGTASKKFTGVVRMELADQSSNRLVMLANSDSNANPVQVVETVTVPSTTAPGKKPRATLVIAKPGDEPALSANEPMYFLLGDNSEHGADAKFQLSFKYRPFEPKGSVARFLPLLSNLYLAYTQTTIWDLGGKSSPFRDTSYRPSIYYRWINDRDGDGNADSTGREDYFLPNEWRAGFEHESNGQAGADSRSINTAFFQPTWQIDLANDRKISFTPKFYDYLDKSDNSDIQRYRGYVDWRVRYGRENGLIIDGLYRQGTGGYTTEQVDFSYPLSDRIFGRTGTFVHLQLFSGYGETLLDYNRDGDTQLRLGISLAR